MPKCDRRLAITPCSSDRGKRTYVIPLRGATGYIISGMARMSLYLPDDLKRAIELEARRRAIPEAEVVRQTLRDALSRNTVRPRGALFTGSEPAADRVGELLDGFGK